MIDDPAVLHTVPPTSVPHLLAGMEGLQRRIGDALAQRIGPVEPGLRGSQGRILSLIGLQGTRPTVLADGAWITKQAMGKHIHDLEARGLVTVEADPTDGRAIVVRRTAEGDRVMRFIQTQIADLERELIEVVGQERYLDFRSVLDELAAGYLPAALLALDEP